LGANLYDLHLSDAFWQVLPAGFDTGELDYKGWDEPVLSDHAVHVGGCDPDFLICGSRTALRDWLHHVLEKVGRLPPDVRQPDGSLTARTVLPSWAKTAGACPLCGRPLEPDQPIVSGPYELAHKWCNDELTESQAFRLAAEDPSA
jgi:hypothetical protein